MAKLDRALLYLALRLRSESNLREHWRVKAQRVKAQRAAVRLEWLRLHRPVVAPPCLVKITRIAPRKLDTDNLQRSAKAVRDEVAETVLQCDDGDERVEWLYGQARGRPKLYAVTVEVVAQ